MGHLWVVVRLWRSWWSTVVIDLVWALHPPPSSVLYFMPGPCPSPLAVYLAACNGPTPRVQPLSDDFTFSLTRCDPPSPCIRSYHNVTCLYCVATYVFVISVYHLSCILVILPVRPPLTDVVIFCLTRCEPPSPLYSYFFCILPSC